MSTNYRFIPIDRLYGLVSHEPLPEHAHGAVLFADVPGFTPLTEAMGQVFGPQRGAEELTNQLNRVYTALIEPVHRYHGAVISFSGDSINCWFDGDDGLRAAAAGLGMQAAVAGLEPFTAGGLSFQPSIKVAIAVGPVRRFLAGDPAIQRMDILTGNTLDVLDRLGHLAERGVVMMEDSAARQLAASGAGVILAGEREDPDNGTRAVIISGLERPVPPDPWPVWQAEEDPAQPERFQFSEAWLLPAVQERLQTGTERFLAELRPVTVLFLNFSVVDDHDEEAGLSLDAYLRKVQECLVRYGGAPLQLNTGDKGNYLYAAFGAPLAHDDDAIRAVTSALELLKISAETGFISGARLGIAHGITFAGAYGGPSRQTYGLIGDKVNVAARLMQQARPGEVLCDNDVYLQARRYWEFDALPPIQLKGKADPTPVYRPLRRRRTLVETTEHPASQARPLATLVGRQAEIDRLYAALDNLQASQGSVLFVEGEAGIGKSRLVSALVEMARDRGLAVLAGSGQSIEQSVPYRAWRDVFQAYFDLGDRDDLPAQQEKVLRAAEIAVPGMLQRLPLLNEVLNLGFPDNQLTSAFDPKLRRESLIDLLIALLKVWMQSGPLVLILEDAHWMDLPSWGLAQTLARVMLLEGRPILMILVIRPLDETHHGAQAYQALRGLPSSDVISLDALEVEALAALIAGQLGVSRDHLPPEVLNFVQSRSDGNPFFAEELIQAMRERGLIMVEPGESGRLCRADPTLLEKGQALPNTLQGLILSRIDRLPAEQQLTLKVAAVIGRKFAYSPLRDTLTQFIPIRDSSLQGHLSELVHRELTQLEIPEPELTYIFKHILTQEAAYQSLLFLQRKEIHLAAARWYEALLQKDETLGASLFPLLAYHYRQAEHDERERYYAHKAGDAAAQAFANDIALAYFTRALELTPPADLEAIYDLRKSRQVIYDLQGNPPANFDEINQLAEIAGRLNSKEKLARILIKRSRYHSNRGEYEAAEEAARQAKALAQQAQNIEAQLDGQIELALVLLRRGENNAALQETEPALELSRALGFHKQEAALLHELGMIENQLINYKKGLDYFQQSLQVHRRAGNRVGEGLGLNNLGIAYWQKGELVTAREYLEQSLAIALEIGARSSEMYALGNICNILFQQRKYDEAILKLDQALALAREWNFSYVEGRLQANLGFAYQCTGAFALALSLFTQGLAISQAIGDRVGEALNMESIAWVYTQIGDLQTAQMYLEKGLQLSQAIGDRETEALLEREYAIWLLWLGRREEALAHSQRGLSLVKQFEIELEKERHLIALGQIHVERKEIDEAEAAFQQAEQACIQLGKPNVEAEAGLILVDLARGNVAQAAARAAGILAFLENDSVADALDPGSIYLAGYQALKAAGDARSSEILSKARQFLEFVAGQLSEEQRGMYFENVPAHKALRARWGNPT